MNRNKELSQKCIGIADDKRHGDVIREIAVQEAIAYAILYVGDCLSKGKSSIPYWMT